MGRPKKKDTLYGVDCQHYAELYAKLLLRDAKKLPEQTDGLAEDTFYTRLGRAEKLEILRDVQRITKELFIASGYAPALVEKLLG